MKQGGNKKLLLYGGLALAAGVAFIYFRGKQTPAAKAQTVTRYLRAPNYPVRTQKIYYVPKRGK